MLIKNILIMRIKLVRIILIIGLILNIIAWHKLWWIFMSQNSKQLIIETTKTTELTQKLPRGLAKLITIVIRQFETYENDVTSTVESFINAFPLITIIIVCDELPYPPLNINTSNDTYKNVKLLNIQMDFNKSLDQRNPLNYIKTKYILFIPDATKISSKQVLQEAMKKIEQFSIVTIPIGKKNQLDCLTFDLKIKEWSLKMTKISGGTNCDSVVGKHATLISSEILKKLTNPFMLPFTDALYLQTKNAGLKIHLMKNHRLNDGKPIYRNQQYQLKNKKIYQQRERQMYVNFGIKKVTRSSGTIDWYGCSRETEKCFNSIVNNMPSYYYEKRLTPPCCLDGLRKVANHVFDNLDNTGIRYWLEGSSLLGAINNGDILPWDYKIEIGVNRDDLHRSPWIVKARNKPVSDDQGFIWQKATEGEFFKIQYSKINKLHVCLLPFYVKNGTMTRDSWFLKNRNFPEHYLHPMSSIEFAGRQIPSPNNVRNFLEIKYYKGIVENPEILWKI